MRYIEIMEQLPPEVRLPLMKAFELFKEELADTVKRSDFEGLKAVVQELAEAQKAAESRLTKLEITVGELAEAQKRTEQRVEELAEAQRRTEEELRSLIRSHRELREEVGGLAHTVGYRLEDESFKALPSLLKKDMGIEIRGRLKRDFIDIGADRYIEVNIWGEGVYDGKECVVIGEARSQLKKKDVDDFIKKADNVKRFNPKEQIRVLVTYQASPHVQRYAKEKNVKIYFSYEF